MSKSAQATAAQPGVKRKMEYSETALTIKIISTGHEIVMKLTRRNIKLITEL